MVKKLLISILLALVFLSIPLAQARAAQWYEPSYKEFIELVYDDTTPAQEIFGERYTAAQVKWIVWSLVHMVVNIAIPDELFLCIASKDGGQCAQAADRIVEASESIRLAKERSGGVPTGKEIAYKYFINNPNSGVGYVASKVRKLSPVDTAYAQGFGYTENQNSVVEELWSAFRNVSYGFFVIIAIVFAFMIMFRFKTSPQTVVTIQSALPKLAITLLLVTFSFAIAGFMIDITYVLIGLISSVFANSSLFQGTQWNEVFDYLLTGPWNLGIVGILIQYCLAFLFSYFIAAVASAYNSVFHPGTSTGAPSVSGFVTSFIFLLLAAVIPLVMLIVFLIVLFKLGWLLLKNFATIILYIAFAPLIITLGAIAPFGGGFSGWVKNLAARLAVYPILSIMIILAWLFLGGGTAVEVAGLVDFNEIINALNDVLGAVGNFMPFEYRTSLYTDAPWVPPLTLGGGSMMHLIYVFISFTIFMLMPSVGNMITAAINKKPFGFGSAVGETLLPAAGLGAAYELNRMRNQGTLPMSRPMGAIARGLGTIGRKTGATALLGTAFSPFGAAGMAAGQAVGGFFQGTMVGRGGSATRRWASRTVAPVASPEKRQDFVKRMSEKGYAGLKNARKIPNFEVPQKTNTPGSGGGSSNTGGGA